jgi:hypothetical protein
MARCLQQLLPELLLLQGYPKKNGQQVVHILVEYRLDKCEIKKQAKQNVKHQII